MPPGDSLPVLPSNVQTDGAQRPAPRRQIRAMASRHPALHTPLGPVYRGKPLRHADNLVGYNDSHVMAHFAHLSRLNNSL